MKNLKQLREERAALISELEEIERAEKLTTEQEARVDEIDTELQNNSKLIERAERLEKEKTRNIKPLNPKPSPEDDLAKSFSFSRAVAAALGQGPLSGAELEAHQEGKREMSYCGISDSGAGIVIPRSVLGSKVYKRAVITENATAGEEVLSFEDALQQESVLRQTGADFVALVSDGKYIVPPAPTLLWEGETDETADVGSAPAKVELNPKRLAGYLDITSQMIRQHTADVQARYVDILGRAVAESLDTAAFGANANVTSWAGASLDTKIDEDMGQLVLEKLLQQLVENKAYRGKVAIVGSASTYGPLNQALLVTGVERLMVNSRINGHPVFFSSNMAEVAGDPTVIVGNWNDYAVCQWGGIEILPDPYTQALKGTLRLVVNSYFDMAQKRSASFAIGRKTDGGSY